MNYHIEIKNKNIDPMMYRWVMNLPRADYKWLVGNCSRILQFNFEQDLIAFRLAFQV